MVMPFARAVPSSRFQTAAQATAVILARDRVRLASHHAADRLDHPDDAVRPWLCLLVVEAEQHENAREQFGHPAGQRVLDGLQARALRRPRRKK